MELIKQGIGQISRKISKEKAKKEKERKEELLKILDEEDPEDESSRKKAEEAQAELDRIIKLEGERTISKAKVDWTEMGEKCTAYFIRRAQHMAKKSNIDSLEVEGEVSKDQGRINKEIKEYYRRLYEAQGWQGDGSW